MIKQGVLLYSGVRYGEITEKRKKLNSNLTIYLDTEIIFHLSGYNGKLFKDLFDDFYKLVKELNSIERKIYFKYFKTTEDEINNYFKKAEFLLEKPTKIDPSKTAMNNIIEGCETKSDIIAKKTKLFNLLKNYNIFLDPTESFLDEDTQKYNLINTELVNDLKTQGYEEYEINTSLEKLNAINILRQEKYSNKFNDIGYILLSGNSKIFKIAWNKYLKNNGEVPLVTHLDFLINKFWLRLNKGFGDGNLPKTFDVITKAQIVLSNSINNNINDKYQQFQKEVQQGTLSKDDIIDTILALKNETKQPEEIDEDILPNILDSLSIKDIEQYKHEKEEYKQTAIKNEKENTKLKKDISRIQQRAEQQEQELLKSKTSELKNLKMLKELGNKNAKKQIMWYKTIWAGLFIGYYILFFIFIYKIGWNTMEKWVWIVGTTLPIIVSSLYTIIYEKKFNILEHISNKKEEYTQKEYAKLKFSDIELSKLENDIQNIQQNLAPNR
jgi:hypothetical protein